MRRLLVAGGLACLVLTGSRASAAVALVASVTKGNVNGGDTSNTTAAIDTTGASLIAVGSCGGASAGGTPTDSASNAYTDLTASPNINSNLVCRWCYKAAPTTSATHTFSITYGAGARVSLIVLAFSGVGTFDTGKHAGNDSASGTTLVIGSLTPTTTGSLEVSLLGWGDVGTDSDTASINASFNLVAGQLADGTGGSHYGQAAAWIETTGALNPTWTLSGTQPNLSGVQDIFVPVVPAATGCYGLLLGVGC